MKLYYAPGTCSLAPHIVAREAGIALELERVDLASKQTATSGDFLPIHAKGYVPALQLDDGEVLSEGPVISQYLADQAPEARLIPAHGTLARYRLLSWLGYINSELHKSYSPLFRPDTPDSVREERRAYIGRRYQLVEQHLAAHPFLGGESFSVADAYLYVVSTWASKVGVSLEPFPALRDFMQRIAQRPAVVAALAAEGLPRRQPAS